MFPMWPNRDNNWPSVKLTVFYCFLDIRSMAKPKENAHQPFKHLPKKI